MQSTNAEPVSPIDLFQEQAFLEPPSIPTFSEDEENSK
eukprot:CAMPEP_0206200636 /NCGR_PEP_ID=MMETSP0166-20121206/11002_1 /ASSEMBLY_ACC=CAM_ASM_000260 /TAXON_ID=95228 /ORGANISM="Vannella robusta, Strain DIVA3 518/3/11/1/6" /LENGTH=37 /DNA_ID= /DNA_START= /DNA_END= /DNA_ORIENTATION=